MWAGLYLPACVEIILFGKTSCPLREDPANIGFFDHGFLLYDPLLTVAISFPLAQVMTVNDEASI